MPRACVLTALCLAGILFGNSPSSALEKWGPFRGQLVDAETGEPIAGAAVLAIWKEAVFSPLGHPTEKFYEALEAVTDAEGRFEVSRLSPPFFRFRISPPQITYFAPGYIAQAEVVTPPDRQPFVAPTVVQMRRLKTREELLRKSRSRPDLVPHEKMPEFIKAVNAERQMLGLDPITPGETLR